MRLTGRGNADDPATEYSVGMPQGKPPRDWRGVSEREWAEAMSAAERECKRLTFPTVLTGMGLFLLLAALTIGAIILGG